MKRLLLALALSSGCASINSQIDLDKYIKKNTPVFIEQQKERFGLTYEGELPTIRYIFMKDRIGACYSDGTIILDPSDLVNDEVRKTKAKKAKNTLHHELAHFNNFKIRKRLGIGYDGTLREKIVEEGTAEYIANTMTGEMKKCPALTNLAEKQYEKTNEEGETDSAFLYLTGACVTGLVIERYGEFGIGYMSEHLPADEEIANPYTYRTRMLAELASQAAAK